MVNCFAGFGALFFPNGTISNFPVCKSNEVVGMGMEGGGRGGGGQCLFVCSFVSSFVQLKLKTQLGT